MRKLDIDQVFEKTRGWKANSTPEVMEVKSAEAFSSMLNEDFATLFVYVNWSATASISKWYAYELILRLTKVYCKRTFCPYLIDLSEQEGVIWDTVSDWLKKEFDSDRDVATKLAYGGAGAFLWINSGKIIDYLFQTSSGSNSIEWDNNIDPGKRISKVMDLLVKKTVESFVDK